MEAARAVHRALDATFSPAHADRDHAPCRGYRGVGSLLAAGCRPAAPRAARGMNQVIWRVGLIDSCGIWPGAIEAAAFVSAGRCVRTAGGDGSFERPWLAHRAIAPGRRCPHWELLLAQVFVNSKPATGAAVAAAIDWVHGARCESHSSESGAGRRLIRRAPLLWRAPLTRAASSSLPCPHAVRRLIPPRTQVSFVQRAMLAVRQVKCRGSVLDFSAAALWALSQTARKPIFCGGASIGAAWVSQAILEERVDATAAAVASALTARARHLGRERKRRSTAT